MKSAIVIRHVHFEDLGAFAAVLDHGGYRIRYLDVGQDPVSADDAAAADLLVVLGGPIGAYEDDHYPFLVDELTAIGRRLAAGRPILGVCLGAQLIARALGARVYPGPAKEIGWAPLQLSAAGRRGPLASLEAVPVLHWHGDTFDLPAGAVRLASTPVTPNQAFSFGDRVLALQFHPEADGAGFERWLIGHAGEIASTPGITVGGLRDQAALCAARAGAAGRLCLAAWLEALDASA